MPSGSHSVGAGGAPQGGGRDPASPPPSLSTSLGQVVSMLAVHTLVLISLSNSFTHQLPRAGPASWASSPHGWAGPALAGRPSRVQCSAEATSEVSVVTEQRAPCLHFGAAWRLSGTFGSPLCFKDSREQVPPLGAHHVLSVFLGLRVPYDQVASGSWL